MLLSPIIRKKSIECRRILCKRGYSLKLEGSYTEEQKNKILQIINESDSSSLTRYDITKARTKYIIQYKTNNGSINSLSDIDLVHGFCDKYAKKLFDSILEGPKQDNDELTQKKLKGQVLHPTLLESIRQTTQTVLTIYVSVNSVCYALVNKADYEVLRWEYHSIEYPEGKRFQITDIMNIAWNITSALPNADIYVMKAEGTTLRAAGSDPNNPKVLGVNLQKAQIVAMLIALINARSNPLRGNDEEIGRKDVFKQKIYFLRPSLPYRLYGTLVGNEKVSTDQTVEMILQKINGKTKDRSHVYISESLRNKFRNQKDLQRDMLGHCLLLALTFMDICMYKRRDSIERLLNKNKGDQ